jgi:hypothetical protein
MSVDPKSAAWKVDAALLDGDMRGLAKAYADAWSPSNIAKLFEELELGYELRSLTYRSSKWMTPAAWGKVMKVVCPDYGDFDATKVAYYLNSFKGISVLAARENSVCIYIKGDPEVLKQMMEEARLVKADESNIQPDGTLRLWWD